MSRAVVPCFGASRIHTGTRVNSNHSCMKMDGKSPIPLWVVLCVGTALLGGIYLLGQPSAGPQPLPVEQPVTAQPPTTVASARPSPAITEAPPAPTSVGPSLTQNKGVYVNKYYGYSFRISEGWRLAADYMQAWNAELELPDIDSAKAEYVVITSTSVDVESRFIRNQFSREPRGEYGFAPGQTVFIVPSPLSIEQSRHLLETAVAASEGTGPADTLQTIRVSAGDGLIFRARPNGTDIIESLYVPCKSFQIVRGAAEQSGMASLIFRMRITGSAGDEIVAKVA